MLKIGGVQMPSPNSMNVGINDISKAERNANGLMIKELIATKRKLDFGYSRLLQTDMQMLLNAVSPNFFSVEYFDPQTGTTRTGTFYSGDRNAGMMHYNGGNPIWVDVKFSLVER